MAFLEVLKMMNEKKMKHLDELIHGKPERIDTDFPMNIRLKCIVRIERTPFILAGEDKLSFAFPGEDYAVEAAGRFTRGNFEFFNFFLRSGSEEAIFQVNRYADSKQVIEAMYYREIFKLFPEPKGKFGDWSDWVDLQNPNNPASGLIGDYSFSTPECLNAPEGNAYEILLPDCPGDRTTPISATERITDDPLISELARVNHYFAVYGRNVDNGAVEKLFVSKDEDAVKAGVSILAGIPIDVGTGTFGNSGFLQVL